MFSILIFSAHVIDVTSSSRHGILAAARTSMATNKNKKLKMIRKSIQKMFLCSQINISTFI